MSNWKYNSDSESESEDMPKVSVKRDRRREMKREIRQLKEDKRRFEKMLDNEMEIVDILEDKLECEREQRKKWENHHRDQEKLYENYPDTRNELLKENLDLKVQLRDKDEELMSFRKNLQAVSEENEELQRVNENLESELNELKQKIETMNDKIEKANNEFQGQVNLEMQSRRQIEEENYELKFKLDEKLEENRELMIKNQEMKVHIVELNEKLNDMKTEKDEETNIPQVCCGFSTNIKERPERCLGGSGNEEKSVRSRGRRKRKKKREFKVDTNEHYETENSMHCDTEDSYEDTDVDENLIDEGQKGLKGENFKREDACCNEVLLEDTSENGRQNTMVNGSAVAHMTDPDKKTEGITEFCRLRDLVVQCVKDYLQQTDKNETQVDATELHRCTFCMKLGHRYYNCRKRLGACYSCGSLSHEVRMCPNSQTACFGCGKLGHVKKYCQLRSVVV